MWDYLGASTSYKVDYTLTMTGAEPITKTVYVSGKKIRTDMVANGINIQMYILADGTYSCNNAAGSWMCTSMPTQASSTEDLVSNQATYTPISMSDKTIAGVTGHCYKLENVNGYDMEYCFSDDGAILWTKTVGEGTTTEMTATSYSTAVTDADFVLPAEVTEMPSYG